MVYGQVKMVGRVLYLLQSPGKIFSDSGVVIRVIGVGTGKLEVDVSSRDGVTSQRDNHLHLVTRGQHELVRAGMISSFSVQISNPDWELAGTLLIQDYL